MGKSKSLLYVPPWSSKPLGPDENIEVSHTIIQKVEKGLYLIDALPTDLNHAGAAEEDWLRLLGVPCPVNRREDFIDVLRRTLPWKSTRTTFVFGLHAQQAPVESHTLPAPVANEALHALGNESDFSADQILDKLEDRSIDPRDRITAILFAETTAFDEAQKPRLLRCLFDFCQQERFTKDDETSTAVGSAIRKLAMNMPTSEFERYSQLFLPTATETLTCDIELELAKAVSWRLTGVTCNTGHYPNLEWCLSELASDYLTPRLILQENYASIAIHAVISVSLLDGVRKDELVDRIAMLGINWFRDLFTRRLIDAIRKREAVSPNSAAPQRLLLDRINRRRS